MVVAVSLLGLALLLAPTLDPARRRLRWLASSRWGRAAGSRTAGTAVGAGIVAGSRWWHPAGWPRLGQAATATAIAAAAAGWLAGPVPALLAATAGWTLAWCWRQRSTERELDRAGAALAAAVGALAEEYTAGATVGAALRYCAPVAGRFAPALVEGASLADLGDDPEVALAGQPALAPLAVACRLANRSGASFASLLQGIRADLAADRATRIAVRAAVAGPRSSAVLLVGLPAVGLAMGVAIGADPARILLRSATGLAALSAGVLLNLAGLVWTMLLTGRASR
jgi:tight adherence protein B